MSGSMWRGCQLRIAEAKPKWDVRLVPKFPREDKGCNADLDVGWRRNETQHQR